MLLRRRLDGGLITAALAKFKRTSCRVNKRTPEDAIVFTNIFICWIQTSRKRIARQLLCLNNGRKAQGSYKVQSVAVTGREYPPMRLAMKDWWFKAQAASLV